MSSGELGYYLFSSIFLILFDWTNMKTIDEGDQMALLQAKALERLISLVQTDATELQTQSNHNSDGLCHNIHGIPGLSGLSNLICFDVLQTRLLELHGSIPLLVSLLTSPNPVLKKGSRLFPLKYMSPFLTQ